jgi:3-hydroxymyristoyl/3-hydroxydecanoyl-(acyl carrier protein) dehydratase
MVMIDALLKADATEYVTEFSIKSDQLFIQGQRLLEAGLIENIAQTAAAGFGQHYVQTNRPIPIGFIGAVQNLKIAALPEVGDCLQTTVNLTHTVLNISVVKGTVRVNGKIAAHCDMKLFLQD